MVTLPNARGIGIGIPLSPPAPQVIYPTSLNGAVLYQFAANLYHRQPNLTFLTAHKFYGIQTFQEAHTDTPVNHAAIFRGSYIYYCYRRKQIIFTAFWSKVVDFFYNWYIDSVCEDKALHQVWR